MGPRCLCRGEAGMGHWGRGANDRGGHGSSCVHRIMLFCSAAFSLGFRKGTDLGSACWLLLGSAMDRGARVDVKRVWGAGGVVLMAARAWVLVPSPHHVLLPSCLLPGLQEGQGL